MQPFKRFNPPPLTAHPSRIVQPEPPPRGWPLTSRHSEVDDMDYQWGSRIPFHLIGTQEVPDMFGAFLTACRKIFKRVTVYTYQTEEDGWDAIEKMRSPLVLASFVIFGRQQVREKIMGRSFDKVIEDRGKRIHELTQRGQKFIMCDYSDYATELPMVSMIDPSYGLYFKEQTWLHSIDQTCILPAPLLPMLLKPARQSEIPTEPYTEKNQKVLFMGRIRPDTRSRDLDKIRQICERAGWEFEAFLGAHNPNYTQMIGEAGINLCPRGYGPLTWRFYDTTCVGGLPLVQRVESHLPEMVPQGGDVYPTYSNWMELYDQLLRLKDPDLRKEYRQRSYTWYKQAYGPKVVYSYFEHKMKLWLNFYNISLNRLDQNFLKL